MDKRLLINLHSEIGKLEGVIIHSPGAEIENMTPKNAERALYSDILNLAVASQQYAEFKGVLQLHSQVFEVKELLSQTLTNEKVKESLIKKICKNENVHFLHSKLMDMENEELTRIILEGYEQEKDNLTKFLSNDRYALPPLHNFFFTRDASVSMYDEVLISRMASKIRARESLVMEAIFDYSPLFNTRTFNPNECNACDELATMEGGDIQIAREDITLIGLSSRTTSYGIDFIIDHFKKLKKTHHIIVQELPAKPESFIHLDMVFTFLDKDKCMVYEPLIMKPNKYQTLHIEIDNGNVKHIHREKNLLTALESLKMNLEPIFCGGNNDVWVQEREQWHSGANFFALAPGKVIGYGRNVYTIDALNKNGFEVLKAKHVLQGKVNINDYQKYVITIEGSELARGGGGARCMTMPVARQKVEW